MGFAPTKHVTAPVQGSDLLRFLGWSIKGIEEAQAVQPAETPPNGTRWQFWLDHQHFAIGHLHLQFDRFGGSEA